MSQIEEKSTAKKLKKLSPKVVANLIKFAIVLVIVVIFFIVNAIYPLKYSTVLFTAVTDATKQGEATVRFLDVGQGDATLVTLPDGQTLLIDGGDNSYQNRLKLLTTLKKSGVKQIDHLVCSNVAAEHSGGLADALWLFHAQTVYLPDLDNTYVTNEYRSLYVSAYEHAAKRVCYEAGLTVTSQDGSWDMVFLSPPDVKNDNTYSYMYKLTKVVSKENIANASAIIWLRIYDTYFLFMGDVLTRVHQLFIENFMLSEKVGDPFGSVTCPVDLRKCNVLKVAKHGDKDSAYTPFYDLVRPDHSVISVGTNSENCPNAQVLSDIVGADSVPHITQEVGDVIFNINKDGYTVLQ